MSLTPDGWLVGARRVTFGVDGGSWVSPLRKWLWHTVQGRSMSGTLATYARTQSVPHLTWDPRTGEIVQHIPFTRAARALKNRAGGVQTNRDGVIQVEVVGYAEEPFTDGPMANLSVLRQCWRELGIPEVWPAGPPPAYPGGRSPRSVVAWAKAGHFGHSQVPENDHGDPGAIDIARLFAAPNATATEEDDMTPEQQATLRHADEVATQALHHAQEANMRAASLQGAHNAVMGALASLADAVAALAGQRGPATHEPVNQRELAAALRAAADTLDR